MKLGTVVFKNKVYNLDYMSSRQIKNLEKKIIEEQKTTYNEGSKIISRKHDE